VAGLRRHELFYESGSLSDGEHTLIINRFGDDSPELWLDYFIYEPSSTYDAFTAFIDDKDGSIQYDQNWSALDGQDNMQNTATTTNGKDASFSLSFQCVFSVFFCQAWD
jgi:hypothetical protein